MIEVFLFGIVLGLIPITLAVSGGILTDRKILQSV